MEKGDFPRYEIRVPRLGRAIARLFVTVVAGARDLWRSAPLRLRLVILWERMRAFVRNWYLLGLILAAILVFGGIWFEIVETLRQTLVRAAPRAAALIDEGASDWEALGGVVGLLASVTVALIAVVTAPFALLKAWISERQTSIAEQGHVTDRMTKAVEQLGAEKTVKVQEGDATVERTEPNLEVRLGAIYALERIAEDSERDHIPIMETLCAYIRENSNARKPRDFNLAPWEPLADDDADEAARERHEAEREVRLRPFSSLAEAWAASLPPPRADLQAALTVIGRRSAARAAYEARKGYRLDLRGANLQRADLAGARLDRALLARAAGGGGPSLRSPRLRGTP